MYHSAKSNRRVFLTHSLATMSALGTGILLSSNLFADRKQLAQEIASLGDGHAISPALKLASESLDALGEVQDYKAHFIKSELVGKNLVNSRMDLKLRENVFSVYLKFVQPSPGREVIYVQGQNNGYLHAHDVGFAGLAGTLSLDPKGSIAMDGNRYPVSNIGMRNMLTKLIQTWLAEKNLQGVTVNIFPNAHIGDIACKAIEISHHQPNPSAKFQMTRLYLDSENMYPIRVQAFNFPGKKDKESPLAEDYMYSDLKVNVGLNDMDFSIKNPKYKFS